MLLLLGSAASKYKGIDPRVWSQPCALAVARLGLSFPPAAPAAAAAAPWIRSARLAPARPPAPLCVCVRLFMGWSVWGCQEEGRRLPPLSLSLSLLFSPLLSLSLSPPPLLSSSLLFSPLLSSFLFSPLRSLSLSLPSSLLPFSTGRGAPSCAFSSSGPTLPQARRASPPPPPASSFGRRRCSGSRTRFGPGPRASRCRPSGS